MTADEAIAGVQASICDADVRHIATEGICKGRHPLAHAPSSTLQPMGDEAGGASAGPVRTAPGRQVLASGQAHDARDARTRADRDGYAPLRS